jgi:hypothetical protein
MTDDEFVTLNAVYLGKLCGIARLRASSGLDARRAQDAVRAATAGGLIESIADDAYVLTAAGVRAVLQEYDDRYAKLRAEASLEEWYERFEGLNTQFLQLATQWQRSADHHALDRLVRVVERQVVALRLLARSIPRYEIYATRFEQALDHVDQGSTTYIVNPGVDSLHTIWFEFHEDVLTVLGRPRDVAEA